MSPHPLLQYFVMHPSMIALVCLMVINLIYVATRQIIGKAQPGDRSILDTLWRKVSALVIVLVSSIVETLVEDLPLVDVVSLFYCGVEVLEILKLAIEDGLQVPVALKSAITVLLGGQGGPEVTPKEEVSKP